jgi:hypothetical protein
MAELTIKTNHHWRPFKYANEVPKKILDNEFDWMEKDEDGLPKDYLDGFICYRGTWYHTEDFMSLHNKVHCPNPPDFMKGWDGYHSDSFFSGVLIKLSDDGECYQIATYYS